MADKANSEKIAQKLVLLLYTRYFAVEQFSKILRKGQKTF